MKVCYLTDCAKFVVTNLKTSVFEKTQTKTTWRPINVVLEMKEHLET